MKKHVRILILDSDKYATSLMENELADKFPDSIVVVFHTAQSALEELKQNRYDAAVIDYDTADRTDSTGYAGSADSERNGVLLLSCIRDHDRLLPLVILTAVSSLPHGIVGNRSLKVEGTGAVKCLSREIGFYTRLPELVNQVLTRRVIDLGEFVPAWESMTDVGPSDIEVVAGKLAHEVNNPLMTILGMTELLLDNSEGQDEGLIKKLHIIRKSAQRIAIVLSRLSGGATVGAENPEMAETAVGYTDPGSNVPADAEFEKP